MSARIVIEGELYLRLEDVAACYEVELAWVREVTALELVATREAEGRPVVPARELDRVAELLRLHRLGGLELVALAGLLR